MVCLRHHAKNPYDPFISIAVFLLYIIRTDCHPVPAHTDTHTSTVMCIFFFQIKHMMAFIDQEASEKAEEIDAKVNPDVSPDGLL